MRFRLIFAVLVTFVTGALLAARADQGRGGQGAAQFIKFNAPVIALTHARVIDGTGAPPREDQTLVMSGGNISALGPTGRVTVPENATVIDLTGKSVIPGLVMVHEHLYYPSGGMYGDFGLSFIRLYLAGGVTTMRTAGNHNGIMDLNIKQRIDSGALVGPAIDATAPYLNGGGNHLQMATLKDAADARRQVDYWADMGATSFKAYMEITRAELGAAIDQAHKRGLKLTGHLCSVTYAEAAAMGIDNLEHGFMASTDFFPNKQPDVCPGQTQGQTTVASLDPQGEPFKKLVATLIEHHVALTSTLPVFETFTPGRPFPPGVDVLVPDLRAAFAQGFARTATLQNSVYKSLFPKGMALELAFAKAGGVLLSGTDPTGGGGVIPGYSNQRQVELLVEEGFTPLEAISISTLNGAKYLGRDARIGSLAVGKQADLVVIVGNPAATISDIRHVDTVFRLGIGYDPPRLISSVAGKVGLW
jgi:enamidase